MKGIKICQKHVSMRERDAERERVVAAADDRMNVDDDIEGSERHRVSRTNW